MIEKADAYENRNFQLTGMFNNTQKIPDMSYCEV